MRLVCSQNVNHTQFLRESRDARGNIVNTEIVDEYGRLVGDRLDLYTGDVHYLFKCLECGSPASEVNSLEGRRH
jgi:hypothetical protein